LIEETEDPSQTSEIRFDEVPLLGGPAVRMTYSDAMYVMARDLSAFLKISTTINAIRNLDKLQRRSWSFCLRWCPRRGAILLTATHADVPTNSLRRSAWIALPDRRNVNVSRTIVAARLTDNPRSC
jgi:hypothetical protein